MSARRAGPLPAKSRTKYSGDYQVRARFVRQRANADPSTRCWRTGLTLAEGRAKWGTKVHWQAGHVDGYTDLLAAELSHPNQSAGAKVGNAKRVEPREPWP
jgi:hypothetical protein